jgi:hypothetical protein
MKKKKQKEFKGFQSRKDPVYKRPRSSSESSEAISEPEENRSCKLHLVPENELKRLFKVCRCSNCGLLVLPENIAC